MHACYISWGLWSIQCLLTFKWILSFHKATNWTVLQLTVISCLSSFRLVHTITMILFYYIFIGKGLILHTVKLKKHQ